MTKLIVNNGQRRIMNNRILNGTMLAFTLFVITGCAAQINRADIANQVTTYLADLTIRYEDPVVILKISIPPRLSG